MGIKGNDQHDGGGSCCMCDLCQEGRELYLGTDVDEIERIINEQKLMLAWNDLREALISCVDDLTT